MLNHSPVIMVGCQGIAPWVEESKSPVLLITPTSHNGLHCQSCTDLVRVTAEWHTPCLSADNKCARWDSNPNFLVGSEGCNLVTLRTQNNIVGVIPSYTNRLWHILLIIVYRICNPDFLSGALLYWVSRNHESQIRCGQSPSILVLRSPYYGNADTDNLFMVCVIHYNQHSLSISTI